MQLGAFTLCACFCFFTSEGVFFRPETALVYTRSESCFPTRRTGTVFGFLNYYTLEGVREKEGVLKAFAQSHWSEPYRRMSSYKHVIYGGFGLCTLVASVMIDHSGFALKTNCQLV